MGYCFGFFLSRFRNWADSRWYLFISIMKNLIFVPTVGLFLDFRIVPTMRYYFCFCSRLLNFSDSSIFFFILFLLTIENSCHSENLYINTTRHCHSEDIYISNKTHYHSIDINKTKHCHSENFTLLFYRLTQ